MRKFKLREDPYDAGTPLLKKKTVTIQPGLTVLVGCNGIGKSTLMHNIRDNLKEKRIPCLIFDNQVDGGSHSIEESLFHGDTSLGATMLCSSEGERIYQNIGKVTAKLEYFLKNGREKHDLTYILGDIKGIKKTDSSERWILLDAIDSGFSIDNVVEVKSLFRLVVENAKEMGLDVYILVSANAYEMAAGEQCFDVYSGKYVNFSSYEDYREFILKTREWKDARLAAERNARRTSGEMGRN